MGLEVVNNANPLRNPYHHLSITTLTATLPSGMVRRKERDKGRITTVPSTCPLGGGGDGGKCGLEVTLPVQRLQACTDLA